MKLDTKSRFPKKVMINNEVHLFPRISPREADEQEALVEWMNLKKIFHFAIPNGGKRTQREGINFKRQGVVAGAPDLMIPLARLGYHGLFIELKRQTGGVVTPPQQKMLAKLTSEGYLAVVCKGSFEAMKVIEEYLKLNKSIESTHL